MPKERDFARLTSLQLLEWPLGPFTYAESDYLDKQGQNRNSTGEFPNGKNIYTQNISTNVNFLPGFMDGNEKQNWGTNNKLRKSMASFDKPELDSPAG